MTYNKLIELFWLIIWYILEKIVTFEVALFPILSLEYVTSI